MAVVPLALPAEPVLLPLVTTVAVHQVAVVPAAGLRVASQVAAPVFVLAEAALAVAVQGSAGPGVNMVVVQPLTPAEAALSAGPVWLVCPAV